MQKKPKCLSVTCSKNEDDFIEVFIRSNAIFIETFLIVDESTDDTRLILSRLIQEGFDIKVFENRSGNYDQAKLSNSIVKRYASDFDFVFYLDVDEILVCNNPELWRDNHREYSEFAQRMYWVPHAPTILDSVQKAETRLADFCAVSSPKPIQKVFMSAQLALRFDIATGAHHAIAGLTSDGRKLLVHEVQSCFSLAHFPLRSAEQFLLKMFKAYHWLRTKRVKDDPAEGHHVIQIYEALREKGFRMSIEDLHFFAANYGVDKIDMERKTAQSHTSNSLLAPVELKYTHPSPYTPFISLMAEADGYIRKLVG